MRMSESHRGAHRLIRQRFVAQVRLVVLGAEARHQDIELAPLEQHRAGFGLESGPQTRMVSLDRWPRGRRQYPAGRSDGADVDSPAAAGLERHHLVVRLVQTGECDARMANHGLPLPGRSHATRQRSNSKTSTTSSKSLSSLDVAGRVIFSTCAARRILPSPASATSTSNCRVLTRARVKQCVSLARSSYSCLGDGVDLNTVSGIDCTHHLIGKILVPFPYSSYFEAKAHPARARSLPMFTPSGPRQRP